MSSFNHVLAFCIHCQVSRLKIKKVIDLSSIPCQQTLWKQGKEMNNVLVLLSVEYLHILCVVSLLIVWCYFKI